MSFLRRTYRAFDCAMESIPFVTTVLICLGFYILNCISALSEFLFPHKVVREKNREGYPPLYAQRQRHVTDFLIRRVVDCWSIPTSGVPGPEIALKHRVFEKIGGLPSFRYTGEKKKCLNLASYNYLGFAENSGRSTEFAIGAIHKYGMSTGATARDYGTVEIHRTLEKLTAEFVGAEDSLACGMGFATNSLNLPMLLSEGCLVLSDEQNHISMIVGVKVSGASVKIFKHNDVFHLERLLKEAIYYGRNPLGETYEPWRKIFILIEGVYSMEGSTAPLPEIIALKKKYKAYLYLDEAHSIGAMGKNGRGVVEYFGCNPKDVDILMGTYTKSFGASGGYIAGSKELISHMRRQSYSCKYPFAMSPPIAAHIVDVLNILMGKDGTDLGRARIASLARNSKYFRRRVNQLGLITYGSEDSPVVPILCCFYSKMLAMVRFLREKDIASIGVGYPVTSLLECRVRICLSASHTKEQLDYALKIISEIAGPLGLKYSRQPTSKQLVVY
ncbi:serine palmitoyltransferase 2-like [Photinus pyralis]|uniref:serine palmitoyltransferase 2-like n=1 Tax=Photinus pyralis TaxID=7054 RepID=UPI0012672A52|nr:serine palmitoyltransferase 2-like [Photinus pyralis]